MSGEAVKKLVFVTGASGGLGKVVSRSLNDSGYSLFLTDIEGSGVKELAEELKANYVAVDLMPENSPTELSRYVSELAGIPYAVIHLAGGKIEGDAHPVTPEILLKSIRFNFGVAAEINTFFIDKMVENGGGKIIHISSDSAETGNASPCYASAKGALNTYVKSTARYYAKDNMLICAIMPSIMDHEKSDWAKKKIDSPEYYEARKKAMPLGRFGTTKEVAELINSICSLEGMLLTGSIIKANGGV